MERLAKDYEGMARDQMFYDNVPKWEDVVDGLNNVETSINARAR